MKHGTKSGFGFVAVGLTLATSGCRMQGAKDDHLSTKSSSNSKPFVIRLEDPAIIASDLSKVVGIRRNNMTSNLEVEAGYATVRFDIHRRNHLTSGIVLHMNESFKLYSSDDWYMSIDRNGNITHSAVGYDQWSR